MNIKKNIIKEWEAAYGNPSINHKNKYPDTDVVSFIMRNFGNVDDKSKIEILELGCGWGNNLSFLKNEGFNYSGIDFAKPAVDYCKTLFSNVIKGDISSMPYEDNSFKCIIDRMSIQHNTIEDIELILNEVFRTLKDGGLFFSISTAEADYGLITTFLSKEKLQLMLSKHTNEIEITEVIKKSKGEIISKSNVLIAKKPII